MVNFNIILLDSIFSDFNIEFGNKYPPDSNLLFNNILPQNKHIDNNSGKFIIKLQNNGYSLSISKQKIQDIDPFIIMDPDDYQFFIE